MSYIIAAAPCLACGRVFSFNPIRVPSFDLGMGRKPVCEACMARVNIIRRRMGLEPHSIMEGAYDPEPAD